MADPWPAIALLTASTFLGASVVTLLWVLCRTPSPRRVRSAVTTGPATIPSPANLNSETAHDAASVVGR
ncbi:hypothetical protein [Methylobacterium sp. Leaf118]|uniref:hypothetical protein n=1 Tax=Methylobacterium sp. Leaf118 TaxID=2876562 RepID=UPI001E5688BA|nr:hypothetical protein [Methylobacterium sp. Leaf118]